MCGTELTAKAATKSKNPETSVQASRMPEVTLSLPAALGALVIVLLIGAAVVYFSLQAGVGGAMRRHGDGSLTVAPGAPFSPFSTR